MALEIDDFCGPQAHAVIVQNLAAYQTPADWHPGASLLVRTFWFCVGSPLVSARCLPGSAWRVQLLRVFGARIGKGCRLKPGLRVKFPWRLQVGQACWLAEDAWLDNLSLIALGDRACLSQGVYLCTGNHNFRSPGIDWLITLLMVLRASSSTSISPVSTQVFAI